MVRNQEIWSAKRKSMKFRVQNVFRNHCHSLHKIPAFAATVSSHTIDAIIGIIADLNVHGVIHIFGHIIDESANHRTAAKESRYDGIRMQ